jgi:hypothetical protein
MQRTIGYHFVKSAYGLWLPGDDRGSWSSAWDDQIGYYEPHHLHEADPVRLRMAEERMKHPAVCFDDTMTTAIADAIGDCVKKSNCGLSIAAFAIEFTHMHLAIPYSGKDIDNTAKWLADQTTKAVHKHTIHQGPVWGKGKWCSFVFDIDHWMSTIAYIQRHNLRHGLPADPYPFITPIIP